MTDETATPVGPEPPTATETTTAPATETATPTEAPAAPEPPKPGRALASAEVPSRRPEYKGEELDPERGPGLGCFWFQVIVLGFFIVLIPIGLKLNWPFELLALLLFVVIGLLLLTGQSVIFLLRLVAADRRAQGRRRPLASPTRTVGELEDEHRVAHAVGGARPAGADVPTATGDDAVSDDDATPAARTHESLPDGQQEGSLAADVPDAAPAEEEPADTAPTPDEARPEEPDPGVRQ